MSQSDYEAWRADGSPFRLMTPAVHLRDILRRHGYTVYDIGNLSHLTHEPPEDHTPYSATGYPGTARYGTGYAIDIMPPASGSGLPSLAQLGARLLADRRAGVPGISWLKYMNWEPGDGNCWHESWQPNYARRASSDRGHIHLSGLTGYEGSTIGVDYDPIARIRGGDMYEGPDRNRDIATTHRAMAILTGAPAARYTIDGRERVEPNALMSAVSDTASAVTELSVRLDRMEALLTALSDRPAGAPSLADLTEALRVILRPGVNPADS